MDDTARVQFLVALIKVLGKNAWVGKTHVQKTAYFAQEAAGIDLGLHFVIHHYGPYSFELESLMQTLDGEGMLKVTPEPDGYGYAVTVSEEAQELDVDQAIKERAEGIAGYFVTLPVDELELLSTSYYVTKRLPVAEKEAWVREVKRLKPRFAEGRIARGLDEARALAEALRKEP